MIAAFSPPAACVASTWTVNVKLEGGERIHKLLSSWHGICKQDLTASAIDRTGPYKQSITGQGGVHEALFFHDEVPVTGVFWGTMSGQCVQLYVQCICEVFDEFIKR